MLHNLNLQFFYHPIILKIMLAYYLTSDCNAVPVTIATSTCNTCKLKLEFWNIFVHIHSYSS